jgi:hypothetical protein
MLDLLHVTTSMYDFGTVHNSRIFRGGTECLPRLAKPEVFVYVQIKELKDSAGVFISLGPSCTLFTGYFIVR